MKNISSTLQYPNDRHNGFVQLTDGTGNLYVPDFISSYDCGNDVGNAMKYAGAFLVLAQRQNNHKNI
jgi:hypothetical protein